MKKIVLITILLTLLFTGIFYIVQFNRNQPSNSSNTQVVSPPSQTGKKSEATPNSDLEECLKKAANSEANQSVILALQEECYRKYQ